MATLVLQYAGAALGSAIGGPLGAMAGRALGAVVGASIDSALLAGGGRSTEGPRLSETPGLGSSEGTPIPRLYGRARLGGELIWATRFEEVVNVARTRGGAFGGKGGLAGGGPTTTTYSYFANVAIGLCEGPIAFVRRVWADGRLLNLAALTMRVHPGDEAQAPDELIVAKEGSEHAPAYRGLAYVVFERLALADFGNRVPQFAFEVVRPVGAVRKKVRAVNLIPGAGEFVYATTPVFQNAGDGVSRPENVRQLTHATDLVASLDQLQALCPNLESVTLVVAWFGDDLRAGHCRVRPKVETADKITTPLVWSVAGLTRATAQVVTMLDGRPAYGGSPSDASVQAAIAEIKARGLKVNLHPFVMMDIAPDNALVDPRSGASPQPAFPWRGEITVDPAPGASGSADGTAAAETQIAQFVGAAAPAHFTSMGAQVIYAGPVEWSLRRFVLHCAKLAQLAGGVDGFILSSELRSLTRVRGAGGAFPMTGALIALAADARAMLGAETVITYAADWTEYGGVVLEAGTLAFPLDALWASAQIDVVAIDWYPPLTDWRDGVAHLDAGIARGPAALDYLAAGIAGGESFDWFYADDEAREAQAREPIVDTAYGKPWVWRAKDLVGWWANAHVARTGGVETSTTAWTPRMKPIWLAELGCPAVDKGANGPNAFPDEKSSSAALPPFSRGARDDLIPLRMLEATLAHFDAAAPDADARNPLSEIYDGRMIDDARTHLWAWDARPFPAFPGLNEVWGDADNYARGHWLNGRLEAAPLDDLVRAMARDFGVDDLACDGLDAVVDGYVVDRPMTLRAALEPLAALHGFGLRADDATLVGGRRPAVAEFGDDDLVADAQGRTTALSRAQESELPAELTLSFSDGDSDYRRASVASRHLSGASRRQSDGDAAIVARRGAMRRLAEMRLQAAWTGRETARFALPPARLDIEIGDRVALPFGGVTRDYEVTRIVDGASRDIEARAVDDAALDHVDDDEPPPAMSPPLVVGAPRIVLLDLPIARGDPTGLQYVAASAEPWPGSVVAWRSRGGGDFTARRVIASRAAMGALLDPLPAGVLHRWDEASSVRVTLTGGAVASIDDLEALAGENAFAIQKPSGAWEIVVARNATLVGPQTWRLSRMLRGLGGSEAQASVLSPAGMTVVRLDGAVIPLSDALEDVGVPAVWRFVAASLDHADARAVEIATTPTMLALKPLTPAHVRARRDAAGVRFTWVRRTRVDGDGWGLDDVPLGEDSERYELDIRAGGGAVLRTLTSAAPTALYTTAQEIADFGSAQATLSIALFQISTVAGRGFAREQMITVS